MLSIYTYPTNSGTGYIDPDYYGSTTGGSETGYYKRILDLKDGTYKTWVTGQTAPVDSVSDLITATGKFHKGVRTENGLENIQIYSYYNQPLITIDSVLINTNVSASDTDASPAARLTVTNSDDLVDGDPILLTAFDGTLAELNGLTRYADVINSTTVDLYRDSGLTDPVLYVPALTGYAVAAINTLGADPTTQPVRVTLTGLFSSYNESVTNFNTFVAAPDTIDRLNSYNSSIIDNAVSDTFEVWETLNTDVLTVDEFLNNDYTKDWAGGSGTTISSIVSNADEYYVSQSATYNDQKIWKIQKKLSNGNFSNGANNLSHTTTYTVDGNGTVGGGSKIYAFSDDGHTAPLTSNQKASVKIVRRAVAAKRAQSTADLEIHAQNPGIGIYTKEVFDDTGEVVINKKENIILDRPNNTWDSDISTNSSTATNNFHWYGSGIGDSTTGPNGGNPPAENWMEFNKLFHNSAEVEKTIGSTTYKVYTSDDKMQGSQSYSVVGSEYLQGNVSVDLSAVTDGSATQYVGYANGSNILSVGSMNSASSSTGNGLYNAVREIWENNKKQLIYAVYGQIERSPFNGARVAIMPVGDQNSFTSYGQTFYQYPIRVFDVGIFERLTPVQSSLNQTYQTLSISSNGDRNTTGGTDIRMQTKSLSPVGNSYFTMHSIISEDKSITGALASLPVVSGQIEVRPTDAWWDVLESGTKIRTNSSSGTEYILRQTTLSCGSTSLRVFDAMLDFGFTNGVPLTNGSAETFWTEGVNHFTLDTTTDYANFGENDTATSNLSYRETDEFRWLILSSQGGNTVDIVRPAIVDSTTGNIALTGTNNHKADNPNVSFPGNQTYKQRTGASTYVNAAIVDDDYYDINSSTTSDFTSGTKPSLTVSQSTEGYISGVSLGSTGRITTGQKMLTIGTTPDSYTPPALTPAEQEDVWDTDDEWASDGFTTPSKEWPDHVTPMSAVINYNSPTLVNNSQSGIKYTRSVGHTNWRLEVEYPPMRAEDFQKFHAIAQAAHGQSTPFYFNLKNKDGVSILWKDFYDLSNSTTTPRVKDATTVGDTTLLVEGFNSNESEVFKRGEVFIDGENENGYLHTSLSGTDANVYGEAKIRTPWPFRTANAAGEKIYKNPAHCVVTLADDNFEYQVDVNNYYFVSVAFDLDSWK